MTNPAKKLFLTASTALMAACGGSGGTPTEPKPIETKPTTPPGVPVEEIVSITVSENPNVWLLEGVGQTPTGIAATTNGTLRMVYKGANGNKDLASGECTKGINMTRCALSQRDTIELVEAGVVKRKFVTSKSGTVMDGIQFTTSALDVTANDGKVRFNNKLAQVVPTQNFVFR